MIDAPVWIKECKNYKEKQMKEDETPHTREWGTERMKKRNWRK